MNQHNVLKERKNSYNRLSINHSSSKNNFNSGDAKRRGHSHSKKTAEIQDICLKKTNGSYLVGWGKIPFLHRQQSSLQIMNKDIVEFACGQEHLVFINNKGETYAMGNNQFGQLGLCENSKNRQLIAPVFSQLKIKHIYCTQFTTFLLTKDNELYSCGLNNRGQLGLASTEQKIITPKLIQKLSQCKQMESAKRKSSKSKINSVYYQEMKKQTCEYENCQTIQTNRNRSNLEAGQQIIDIRGGPFHTIILTSKGRLFYSGNLYSATSILQDQFTNEFVQLNTRSIGKITAIRSHLTGFAFLTHQNRLYGLGFFGEHMFNEPELIDNINVQNFHLNEQGIYIIDSFGDIYYYNSEKQQLKRQAIPLTQKMKDVFCGVDFALLISKQSNVYGKGDNSQHQLSPHDSKHIPHFTLLEIGLKQQQEIILNCSNNFVLTLLNRPPMSVISKSNANQSTKYKDLQRENKILKDLLCNKNKKSVKVQTDKESKFDLQKPLDARTFDNSMQIPFEQLTLGKQISEGGYGIIFKAKWRKSQVAVKVFKIQQNNQNAIRDFISQCHAMEALRHPNIVMFLGACTKPPHFAIVLEYCEGGTLWSLLQKQQEELTWDVRRDLALDTARGMNYLHQRGTPVLHRDLKSLNLLLDHRKRIKLADFGWTKGLQNYMTGKIGTYQWMAPQVISSFQYTQKADIFSFGIILWQIASREAPYRNIPGPQVAQDVMTKDLRPTIPKKTPQKFADLIRRCWDKSPSVRPSFSEVITELQQMRFN